MSSVVSAKSQIPALKTYITTTEITLLDEFGQPSDVEISTGHTLRDMGKTVFLDDGDVLRKVEGLPVPTTGGYLTGFINLGPNNPTTGIVRMN